MAERPRVLLVDDHTMVRAGVRTLLENAQIQVVGDAKDGREAVRLCAELTPDVVILDVAMPDMNGIEAARAIRQVDPHIGIIMLSMHSDRHYVAEAVRAGASGYVLKDAAFSELRAAVVTVASGGTHLGLGVEAAQPTHTSEPPTPSKFDMLSSRERQVLELIAESKTNAEIARVLYISPHTVDTHRRKIMEKLDLHNVVDLVKFAIRHGLADVD